MPVARKAKLLPENTEMKIDTAFVNVANPEVAARPAVDNEESMDGTSSSQSRPQIAMDPTPPVENTS